MAVAIKFPAKPKGVPLGELAANAVSRLRGYWGLTGAAPHPALRATFPRRVKASVVAGSFLYV